MTRTRLRRWAETFVVLGLCLLAASAVAAAQDVTPTPTPTPEAVVTATPSPIATLAPTLTPEPTPTQTATATASPSPSPSPAPVATEAPPVLESKAPQRQATPTPTPTPAPVNGASLTICHLGDSGYVPVTIAADEPSDHFDHELDIIPAPPSGCASSMDPDVVEPVTVCHLKADGSYVLLRYPVGDLGGHERDPGDLIPAPGGTCPGLGAGYAVPTSTPTATPTAAPTAEPEPDDEGDVIGEEEQGDAAPATSPAPAAATAMTAPATTAQELPFTGFDLWLIASAGLGLTLMGAGLRLLSQPAVGVTL